MSCSFLNFDETGEERESANLVFVKTAAIRRLPSVRSGLGRVVAKQPQGSRLNLTISSAASANFILDYSCLSAFKPA